MEQHHLNTAEKGAEFASVHNHDSADFMNQEKFHGFILRKTKSSVPFEWDLLDETSSFNILLTGLLFHFECAI